MWCCRFKDNEWVVCSLRSTQKGSIKAALAGLEIGSWKLAKIHGIRCEKVEVAKEASAK